MIRSAIGEFASIALGIALSLSAASASARVDPGACGGATIPRDADCAVLQGDACDAPCNDFLLPQCLDRVCESTHRGPRCSVMATELCEEIVAHECDHICHTEEMTKLFCDGALISNAETCLPELCSEGFDIENYTCACP